MLREISNSPMVSRVPGRVGSACKRPLGAGPTSVKVAPRSSDRHRWGLLSYDRAVAQPKGLGLVRVGQELVELGKTAAGEQLQPSGAEVGAAVDAQGVAAVVVAARVRTEQEKLAVGGFLQRHHHHLRDLRQVARIEAVAAVVAAPQPPLGNGVDPAGDVRTAPPGNAFGGSCEHRQPAAASCRCCTKPSAHHEKTVRIVGIDVQVGIVERLLDLEEGAAAVVLLRSRPVFVAPVPDRGVAGGGKAPAARPASST